MVFFDTEFTFLKPVLHESSLISMGLITEDGNQSFYAEIIDSYSSEDCSDFVKQIVLPLLDAPALTDVVDYSAIYARMSTAQVRDHLRAWFKQLNYPVELYSDGPYFDWHFVVELFKGHPWPENLLRKPKSCVPESDLTHIYRYYKISETAFASGKYRQHHSLDDAKVMRLATLESRI